MRTLDNIRDALRHKEREARAARDFELGLAALDALDLLEEAVRRADAVLARVRKEGTAND